eukprot:CAMPEP_0197883916 /NCGR_PEP_ID=MMETSP1439-20131203/10567_1 /TAXON_ID=66791 /ORGANISM="Gonyaulax spinifera, Strain CCMP409" /LENGTH=62 /DNA_ID=CAMNT_0043503641 /DNA_START=80 /DNA_END=265 /DNA_ORIENTATION=+
MQRALRQAALQDGPLEVQDHLQDQAAWEAVPDELLDENTTEVLVGFDKCNSNVNSIFNFNQT